jgi:hypothetical protein
MKLRKIMSNNARLFPTRHGMVGNIKHFRKRPCKIVLKNTKKKVECYE